MFAVRILTTLSSFYGSVTYTALMLYSLVALCRSQGLWPRKPFACEVQIIRKHSLWCVQRRAFGDCAILFGTSINLLRSVVLISMNNRKLVQIYIRFGHESLSDFFSNQSTKIRLSPDGKKSNLNEKTRRENVRLALHVTTAFGRSFPITIAICPLFSPAMQSN